MNIRRTRERFWGVPIAALFLGLILGQVGLIGSVADSEFIGEGTRGSSESTWTQTTQMDFENGTSTDVIITPSGEVKLELVRESVEDDFTDESRISHKENVIVDTAAGEVRLQEIDDPLINKTFGGSTYDYGNSIQPTSDNGYVMTGYTASYGAGKSDVWLIKTDSLGNEQWNRTFGGSDWEWGISVQQTSDNGYIISGDTGSYGSGDQDAWLIKTDDLGIEQWNRTHGGSGVDYGQSVQQTSDGGYIMAGLTASYDAGNGDVWLVKTNNLGYEQWNRTFGGSEWDMGLSVQQTSDGGYVVAGCTRSYAVGVDPLDVDMWLIKTDSSGNEQWNRTFGGIELDEGLSVIQTSDDGFIMTGTTQSFGAGNRDVWLVKTDSSGNEQWNRTFGGSRRDDGQSVIQTPDDGYVIAGATESYGAGELDVWLIKTDSLGSEEWNKTYGGGRWDVSSFHMFGVAVQQTHDNAYAIVGSTESFGAGEWDVWLLKANASGNPQGNLVSVNLLSGQDTHSIETFGYTAIIPTGSGIGVQFSQDSLTWYDSYHNLNQWNGLSSGSNSIDLSGLGWQGSGFYYRMRFTSNSAEAPILQSIILSYSQFSSSGILESEVFDSETYPTWKTLNWSATTPPGTEIKFQIRSASSRANLASEDFLGSDGSSTTFYATSGQSIHECHERERWLQYKAYLSTTDQLLSPILEDVSITYVPIDTDDDDIPDFEDSDDDNDGLPDSWESQYGFSPLVPDASGDPDFDTLKNLQEFQNHTDPLDNDTDGDGLGDGFEIVFSKTNPTILDTNGDGFGDGLEFVRSQGYMGLMQSLPDDWIGITIAWEDHLVLLRANSSVLEGEFEREKQRLKITVSGPDGSQGITEIDIPNDLCTPGDIVIELDGETIDYSLTESATHYLIRVEYTHSTHEISAGFGQTVVVPSGISDILYYLVASMAAIITLVAAIAVVKYRRGREDIGVQELPPEKLSKLLEKKHSEGKVTKETYQDIKSLLRKYGEEGKGG